MQENRLGTVTDRFSTLPTAAPLSPALPPHALPAEVRSVAAFFAHDPVPAGVATELGVVLPPELDGAVPRRRAEYLAGRWCARAAVRALVPGFTGQIGSHGRAPRWPPGIVGSITHSGGFACAAVACASDVLGVGIDSETIGDPERIAAIREAATVPAERRPDPSWGEGLYYTLMFSAKESLFKCLYPATGRMFWCHEARITLGSDTGRFRATLLVDLSAELHRGRTFEGTYRAAGPLVHTALIRLATPADRGQPAPGTGGRDEASGQTCDARDSRSSRAPAARF